MELMISTSILAGILYAGSMIVQQQEQAQRKISRGISRNAAFNMIGKKLLDETQCNTFLRGHTFGQNISNILQNTLPKEIQQKMTVSAATILDHALSPV